MILVTGATGNVGRPLVDLLVEAGAKVRAGTRDPQPNLPDGVEIEPSSTPSLSGVTAIFVNSRAVGTTLGPLIDRARAAGVRRVVALAAINVDDPVEAQPSRYTGDRNKEVEAAAIDSGLEWVSLRPTIFGTNSIGLWAKQIAGGDTVYGPYATASWSPIDPRDVAGVAARALLGDDLLGRKIELTGPGSLTLREMVATIGSVIGRDLTYQEIPPDQALRRFAEIGLPDGFGPAMLTMLARNAVGPAPVTGEVERILSRPATSFAEWVTDHKGAFRA
ncbi:NAD(P)H-binding protein [Actinocrispum wychmicini]|uniref:Uncharacterized protein YbjT (DUF2867 family) n=1 Tax=Actinocrispum wychmicini TaxID=1213861 RepID=A0A4R2IYF1_9PSEU|nr:NAD(P)H-binding protein [Actinocrispum wychmicini]TCO50903.1 uncharacterized protein YbjT (DUF2867 family) [Actinocrispum wychmicini]